ncbi:MAG: DUF4843 domain-containing protein, partial [Odoribacter sp.]
MKNNLKIGLLIGLISLFAVSCSEDQIANYSGPDAINLRINQKDSAETSFLAMDPAISEYTFNVEVEIQSLMVEKDREVNFALGNRTTAVVETNFVTPLKITIPAGKTSAILPVTVYKKGLVDVPGGLAVELVVLPSTDFVPGVYGKVKLAFSGDFPKNWYSSKGNASILNSFIGKCTKNKYQFVFDYLKTIDMAAYTGWDYGPMTALKDELNTKLDAY